MKDEIFNCYRYNLWLYHLGRLWLILHGVSSDFDIDILWLVIYKIFNMDDVKCKLYKGKDRIKHTVIETLGLNVWPN